MCDHVSQCCGLLQGILNKEQGKRNKHHEETMQGSESKPSLDGAVEAHVQNSPTLDRENATPVPWSGRWHTAVTVSSAMTRP